MANIRTFIAVEIPPSVQTVAERQIEHLCRAGAEFRWVDPKKLHLTLRFLGNIRDTEIPELCQVVQQAVSSMEPIMVSVKGLGAFPNLTHPKVIWLGIGEGKSELQQLQRQVSVGLQKMGFPIESTEFRPHLTLGRIAGSSRLSDEVVEWIERHHDTEFGGFEIDQVIVFSSFLDKEGKTHTPMATIELDG